MDIFKLAGKTAVVTGGNGGIGLGIARGLAQAGANIVVVARKAQKTAAAVAEIERDFRVKAIGIEADVSRETAARTLVQAAVERFGRLDILVNNAGISIRKQPQDFTLEEYNEVVNVNLTSAFLCSKAAYPEMKKAGAGKILNIGSMAAIFGSGYAMPYAVSKGGVVQLTKSLAISWAADNIQVNAIMPGWIDTELTGAARQYVPGLYEKVLARTPAARWGKPADLAGTAVFLCGTASDFVTGTAIPVDGGYSIM